jgi:hypothetical protein
MIAGFDDVSFAQLCTHDRTPAPEPLDSIASYPLYRRILRKLQADEQADTNLVGVGISK